MSSLRPLLAVLAVACAPALLGAQRPQLPVRGWELPGLDISPNGGWRVKARAVAARRAALLGRRDFTVLNAAPAGPAAATAITGTLNVPVIMFRYQDSPAAQYARDTSQYDATLFGAVPPGGKPYTLRTFYEQMSNGLFSLQGQAFGWVALSGNEDTYAGTPGTCTGNPFGTKNCNGLFSGAAFSAMQNGLVEALQHADSQIDFSQYDNDGPDGIANSGDDDGIVDAVLFLHPAMDGACGGSGNNHLWSHRASLDYTGNVFTTNDNRFGGGKIVVNDYILQSGLGRADGSTPCDSTAIMPIGTAAHELGHILALPDLYDTGNSTEGIGEYGLMGSGNYTSAQSPARYDAWSLEQMGWTTVVPLTTTGTYSVGPVPTADSVFYVNVQGSNVRGEYFLLSNRQAVQSDSAMIAFHCRRSGLPSTCGGGLLIWHVDSVKACMIGSFQGPASLQICPANDMNSGPIHGLALEQADGLGQLDLSTGSNRGDAGDPYPGATLNRTFSFNTIPAALKNADGGFVGFAVDSVRQLVLDGEMSFRLRFGGLTVVRASDTSAQVSVDDTIYHVFRNLLEDGSLHTVAVADTQFSNGNRTLLEFQSWSDSGAISHQITAAQAGSTFTATLSRAQRLDVIVGANGTVAYTPTADSNGTYITEGTPVTLVATPTSPFVFGGWTGDTIANDSTLMLAMGRPYAVTAHFDSLLAITSAGVLPDGVMGSRYDALLEADGGGASRTWSLVVGDLPGLTLLTSGALGGYPDSTGTFVFTAQVTSGAQQVQQQFSITVTAPTLSTAAVVQQLLTGSSTLSNDDMRYMDLLGNRNCGTPFLVSCFDVGDFLAWVKATGATPVLGGLP